MKEYREVAKKLNFDRSIYSLSLLQLGTIAGRASISIEKITDGYSFSYVTKIGIDGKVKKNEVRQDEYASIFDFYSF